MKKIFFADTMMGTLLWDRNRERLQLPEDIVITETVDDADVIIARFHNILADYFHLGREYYVYTHEPKFSQTAGKQVTDAATGQVVHVSNAFNGDIYVDPLYYAFPFRLRMARADLRELVTQKSKPWCAMLATYRRRFDRYIGDLGEVNVDLCEERQRIAVQLQQEYNFCDIYGTKWPNEVMISGQSRFGETDWHRAKWEVLLEYEFNLAFENTIIENYVTEKVWDAFRTGCVPVYYGRGSGIYSVLSESSFVDYSLMSSVAELHDRMASMSLKERLAILESGFNDIEKLQKLRTREEVSALAIDRFVERIRSM